MGEGFTPWHASCLAACLPSDSAVARAEGDGWSESEALLALIKQAVDTVWWQRTEDGSRRGSAPPALIDPPNSRSAHARTEYTRADMDAIADALGIAEDRR